MRRAIRINFIDGTSKDLEISSASSVRTSREMIYFEKDKIFGENWRLVYNEKTIPDFSKVKNFEVIREE